MEQASALVWTCFASAKLSTAWPDMTYSAGGRLILKSVAEQQQCGSASATTLISMALGKLH